MVTGIDGDRDIRVDVPSDLGPVTGDRTMIGFVLTNVLSNSAKYSPPDRPCMITARADRSVLRITVEDAGIGMSPEQLAHAFDPFWQADSSSTRERGGVGLGLYLVKQLSMTMRGEVTLESAVGKGTRFTLTLRAAASQSPEPSAGDSSEPATDGLVAASR
jgi:signal transduction histidine kinase